MSIHDTLIESVAVALLENELVTVMFCYHHDFLMFPFSLSGNAHHASAVTALVTVVVECTLHNSALLIGCCWALARVSLSGLKPPQTVKQTGPTVTL